jgi:hypothetical protein
LKYSRRPWRLRDFGVTGYEDNRELVTPHIVIDEKANKREYRCKDVLRLVATSMRAALELYVELLRVGCVFFEAEEEYHTETEARAAIFRLKRLAARMELQAEVVAVAPVAGCPAYAELLPRNERFAPPSMPSSYTRSATEERWRAICRDGVRSQEDLSELRGVAVELEVWADTPEELRRVIPRQYELEFGERARVREHAAHSAPQLAKHTEAPTSEQVAMLLASASSSSSSKK